MKIQKSILERFAMGEANVDPGWVFIDKDIIDEWRWGIINQVVLQSAEDGSLYGYAYQEQSGDRYWNSFEDLDDEEEIELYPVKAVMTLSYQRVRPDAKASAPDSA